ncbi:LOW QUALITY PROTEIN: uncharacterized protein LOC135466077 [Liolophura sinensis]|uniref:LOW QUALITY PROTEIN: uncharacterized protein LOC135466077 n=1 Tax=Liolophura sinensis TaxID=3198878 RepID=UPI00315828DB
MSTLDEKLRWLEARIASSLRPRNEDLRNMFINEDNRRALHEFTQNEDVRRLFVYINPGPSREIVVSLHPPENLSSKSVFFIKTNSGIKLTNENMDEEVMYVDCSSQPLEHLNLLTRQVFLPFLCTNQNLADASGMNADKLMDVLHKLMATVEVTQGQIEGKLVLSLPSVEVLAEAAANPNRRASVLHVLETTVIGWIKQIKIVLRHEPLGDLYSKFGPEPGPLDEVEMWESQLSRLHSLNQQLDTPIARDILLNLEQANSQYAHSFCQVRKDINKAVTETQKILRFLHAMFTWFEDLHRAMEPQPMITTMKPLMTALNLVWTHSRYYHQMDKFHNLLRLISNEVVHRAQAMVGEDILREPLQSYSKLKDALRVCAAFRGTYLDYKDRADDVNAKTIAENEEKHHNQADGTLFKARLYGPNAYVPRFGLRHSDPTASDSSLGEDEIWTDSPWPPRNAACFNLLNSFMERCNDVLELVETTRHFRLLAGAADVGGAGSMSLDAMVKEIHKKYQIAMDKFFSVVDNILNIDGSQTFEKAFFTFRTVVKMLEKQLAEILRQAFQQCHTLGAQLRLLEVFEGISSRELVQLYLKDKDDMLVESYTLELECVRNMFQQQCRRTPLHYNMPPIVSRLLWVHALKERIKCPMEKMRKVSPHSLEGERGWQMRDAYDDILKGLNDFETELIGGWKESLTSELSARLKQPLLIAEEYDEELEIRPQAVHVNLDPKLLLLMKEVHYLHREPFSIKLPQPAKELIRHTDSLQLRVTATRLETIVSKYNTILKTITDYERPLFERKLDKVDQLFEQGLNQFTWKMKESVDFIESAMSLVCLDVHQNLDVVQTNCHEVAEITISWSKGTLDIFKARDPNMSYSIEELLTMQKSLEEEHESVVIPSGIKIHNLVQKSFEAVQISQASPAWRDYVDYMDAIVLDGLKQSTLTSLKSMLNTLVMSNTTRASNTLPILTLRLELVENRVAFTPPLDQLSSVVSVQEIVSQWLKGFLDRGRLVKMLGPKGSYLDYIMVDEEVQRLLAHINKLVEENSEECKGSYLDYIMVDEEVQRLLAHINKLVEENSEECKNLYSLFSEFSFLWLQDVNQSFEEFLHGKLPLHLRQDEGLCVAGIITSQPVHKGSHEPDPAERSFLSPKQGLDVEESNVPTLDEFDQEIDIYRWK